MATIDPSPAPASQSSPVGPDATVIEVTDATFGQTVLEESHRRPVVVDFWAEWCAPCRTIGPVLERLARERKGEFLLAKLDVDANPQAAAAFRIQSIPAVKAFRDGRLLDEFIGAIPETAIRQFIDFVLPSESDRLVAQAEELEDAGRLDAAERAYRRAFELDARSTRAGLGLGRLAAARGDVQEARTLLAPLRPDPEAERILAALEVSEWADGGPSDGPLGHAERAAADGRFQEALEVFLAAVTNGTPEDRDRAREAMLKLFAVLGDDDPLTAEYRRKLASALF
jgi:putative thioredoxin